MRVSAACHGLVSCMQVWGPLPDVLAVEPSWGMVALGRQIEAAQRSTAAASSEAEIEEDAFPAPDSSHAQIRWVHRLPGANLGLNGEEPHRKHRQAH